MYNMYVALYWACLTILPLIPFWFTIFKGKKKVLGAYISEAQDSNEFKLKIYIYSYYEKQRVLKHDIVYKYHNWIQYKYHNSMWSGFPGYLCLTYYEWGTAWS